MRMVSFTHSKTHWISEAPKAGKEYQIRTRHRAPLSNCKFLEIKSYEATVHLDESLRALTPGQSAVFYDGEVCIGSGIIV